MNVSSIKRSGIPSWIRIYWPVGIIVLFMLAMRFITVNVEKQRYPALMPVAIRETLSFVTCVISLFVARWIQRRRYRIAGLKSNLILKICWWILFAITVIAAAATMLFWYVVLMTLGSLFA
jgi:hypothetical protein